MESYLDGFRRGPWALERKMALESVRGFTEYSMVQASWNCRDKEDLEIHTFAADVLYITGQLCWENESFLGCLLVMMLMGV